jgi:hypothetical protein
MILMDWAGIDDDSVRNIISGHSDIRQKLMMMKGLGFMRFAPMVRAAATNIN